MHASHAGTASIAIQAIQGTKGGPKVGGDPVTIELFGKGGKLDTIDAQLDEHGVATLEGLPLAAHFVPKVTVKHAGVSYEAVGQPMDAARPSQKITVTVHETSDREPDWQVQMWHIMLHPTEEGIHVSEMLAVDNPRRYRLAARR